MNIAITNRCDKNCSFCFMTDEPTYDMSIEEITKWAEFSKQPLTLMGGEPTSHPDFKKMFETLSSKYQLHLFSNFLFDDDVTNFLSKYQKTGVEMKLLANGGDLDVGDRILVFKKNWDALSKSRLKPLFSLVIDYRKPKNYYVDYLNFIENRIDLYEIRLSLFYPGRRHKQEPYFIGNFSLGKEIVAIGDWIENRSIRAGFDCFIYPCMFEKFELFQKYRNKNLRCFGAIDVINDDVVLNCWPCRHVDVRYTDFENFEAMLDSLNSKYNEFQESRVPTLCKTKCPFFKKCCFGPCGAFYTPS